MLFHAWLASYTHEQNSGRTTYYYSYLAQGFRRGHLYLPLQPDPQLLAMENPYDPVARAELEKKGVVTPVDFSLYDGKLYLYWGPVPGLLLSIVQRFSPQPQPIADFFLAFLFGIGILLAQTLLLSAVWRQHFSELPAWIFYISVLLAGLIWPVALLRHEHNHARIYEAAIAAGQFFLISGLWMSFTAMTKESIPNWRLTWAGFLWVLAIGSRNVLLIPISFVVLVTSIWITRRKSEYSTRITKLIYLILPLVLGGALLAWYNWARFGSISETGYSYQLAGVDLQNHSAELFSGSYVIQNLYNYLLHPPQLMADFPFISMLKGFKNPRLSFYYAEPMTGVMFMFPFCAFAVLPLFLFRSKRSRANVPENHIDDSHLSSLHWITLSLGGSILLAIFLLITFFWSGMRYAADFLPSLAVLSAIGFWQGFQVFGHKRNYRIAGIVLASISILVSSLLAIAAL